MDLDFKKILPKRPEKSNKGTFGHVLNIAGCNKYRGAAYLSSISALKVGCGLVTLASETEALRATSSLVPDIILHRVEELNKEFVKHFQTVSIGCGLSQSRKAVKTFKSILKMLREMEIPLVIDADGLNILSSYINNKKNNGNLLPVKTVLTPHPKEMSRLMNVSLDNILFQPDFWVKLCSEKYNCTTVLKMDRTLIADGNGNFYENNTGNSALAHGGTGDVLCGMISGFLAQGVPTFEASCLGVYLHGLTAEVASKELTEYSVLASDLIKYIPQAIKKIQ